MKMHMAAVSLFKKKSSMFSLICWGKKYSRVNKNEDLSLPFIELSAESSL